jgi:hypothetical protein
MRAELVYRERKYLSEDSFQEIKIWKVPESTDKPHGLKYSFAFIVKNKRIVCYDNHEQKSDHRHYKDKESPYKFQSLEKLWNDFSRDIERFLKEES